MQDEDRCIVEFLRDSYERLGPIERRVIDALLRYPEGLLGSKLRVLTKLKPSQISSACRGLEKRDLIIRVHPTRPPFSVYIRLTKDAYDYFSGK